MPRLTQKEREKRRQKVQEQALEAVAARGQFNFRLDGEDIKRLYALAGARQVPVSAMVREWVLERLDLEETKKHAAPIWAQALEDRIAHTEAYLLAALFSFGSVEGHQREAICRKIRDHVQQHLNIDTDEELRSLLAQ
jgi:hypothetical protein